MPNYAITLTGAPLNVNAHWTIEQFHQAQLQSISGTVSSSNLILGKIGGTMPTEDVGPWLDRLVWKAWFPTRTVTDGVTNTTTTITSATINFSPSDVGKLVTGTDIQAGTAITSVEGETSATIDLAATGTHTGNTLSVIGNAYFPIVPVVGSRGIYVSLVASLAATNKVVELQDKNGTIALLEDVYASRATAFPTMNPSPATTDIDWSLSNSFGLPLIDDLVLTMSNSVNGQEIFITAYNAPLATKTITWTSSTVHFSTDDLHLTSPNDATTLFVLRNIGGSIYGATLQPYS